MWFLQSVNKFYQRNVLFARKELASVGQLDHCEETEIDLRSRNRLIDGWRNSSPTGTLGYVCPWCANQDLMLEEEDDSVM